MNKIKFLAIGALALGVSTQVLASDNKINTDIQYKIQHNIEESLKLQFNNNILKEHSDITVNIIPSLDTLKKQAKPGAKIPDKINLTENNATLINNICKVTLSFDDKGNVPALTEGEEILSVTKFQNENQKKIAQQFIALHEQFHCEFTTIENPIVIFGESESFNKKINYLLKDQVSAAFFKKVSYIDTLNENFADTSAALALVKQYGADNPDLNYVLKALTTQRHDAYFANDYDTHASHFSLESALSKDNLEKLKNANDNATFKQLSLNIANYGVQQIMSHKPQVAEVMTSMDSIKFSAFIDTMRLIHYESANEETRKTLPLSPWKKEIKNGFAFELAKNMIEGEDFISKEFYRPDGIEGRYNADLYDYAMKLTETKKMGFFNYLDWKGAEANLNQFRNDVVKNVATTDLDFVNSKLAKEEIKNKVMSLRNNFLESTKNINTPTLN